MKKMLTFLFLAVAPFDLSFGQVVVQPATQAEVNQGRVAWKYVSPLTFGGSSAAAQAAASDYAIRANITNDSLRLLIDKLVSDLNAAGVWQSLEVLYPFPNNDPTSCAQNLVSSNYPITWVGLGAGLVFSNGVTANGSGTNYGRSGFSMTNLPATNVFMYVFCDTNDIGDTSGMFGALNGANDAYISAQFSSTNEGTTVWPAMSGSVNDTLGALDWFLQNVGNEYFKGGNFMVWRSLINSARAARSDGLVQSNGVLSASSTRPGNLLYLCGINSGALGVIENPGSTTLDRIGAAGVGREMSLSAMTNFFKIMTAYRSNVTLLNIQNQNTTINAATNTANFTITTNDWVLNQYYTNVNQRAWVQGVFTLTAAAAGTASVGLFVDQNNDGLFELTNNVVSAGPLAALVENNFIGGFLNPNARFVFTNVSTGAGETSATRPNSSQWIKQ